ncbi:MAG: glycoside hydrolase family 3 protein [Pyrinomonadaceae bacterium]
MQLPDISSLTLAEKIGQLFFIGIPGDHIDGVTERLMADVRPGGICLFARNIKEPGQVRKLVDGLRDRSMIEPLLSVDQEGGLVDRLRKILGPMPAPARLATPQAAAEQAKVIAESLTVLGLNMDFAPVVDVIDPVRAKFNNGLRSRAFASTADGVIEMALSFLDTLQANGIIGCVKHFPGLGAAEVDSHEELPTVTISAEEFRAVDLEPFRHLISGGSVSAVMVAHAAYPNLGLQETGPDGRLLPASLSSNFVTNLLRQELGFNGLVLTDDLEMGAIVNNYGIGEASVSAISAGHDMVAICAGVDSIRDAHSSISRAVSEGRLDAARIDDSVGRILAIKAKLSRPRPFDLGLIAELSQQVAKLNDTLS